MSIEPDGYVLYRDFGFSDGAPIGGGRYLLSTLKAWAARPQTDAEMARLDWVMAHAKDRAYLRGLLDGIPDETILDEYRRRGLDRHMPGEIRRD